MAAQRIKVTIWNEFIHETEDAEVKEVYPEGIHKTLAAELGKSDKLEVKTSVLSAPEQGLSKELLADTDVLLWWGHQAHEEVKDKYVEGVYQRVMSGMGLIPLHSAHASRIFNKLCGTASAKLKWRESGEEERLWVIEPGHPIAAGLDECIVLPQTEMYGEHFNIPEPDKLIFISWFEGGEVFRSGCCYYRGAGKIFYFRPGHETYPIYHNEEVIKILINAVEWAAPVEGPKVSYGQVK